MKRSDNPFYLILVSFLFMSLLSSCGGDDSRGPASLDYLALEARPARVLNSQERSLVLEICYAYRSKWSEFRQNFRGEKIDFHYDAMTCEFDERNRQRSYDQKLETTLVHLLDSAPMVFDSPELLDYIRNMKTHLHGRLSPLCQKAMRGETIGNQISLSSNEVAQFRFYREDEFSVYEVGLARIGEASELEPFHAYEIYRVLTRPPPRLSNYLGVVAQSRRFVRCSRGVDGHYFQDFLFPSP